MLTLTRSAAEAVDTLLQSESVPDDAGLRIAATDESRFTVGLAAAPEPGDQIIEEHGARVFVDQSAAQQLDDAQLDARNEGGQIAFALGPQDDAEA